MYARATKRFDLRESPSPLSLFKDDLRSVISQGVACSILYTVAIVTLWLVNGQSDWLLGAPILTVASLAGSFLGSASGRWFIESKFLAIDRKLPWRAPIKFLEDARQKGVLRQAGGFYEFRHMFLLEHLSDKALSDLHRQGGLDFTVRARRGRAVLAWRLGRFDVAEDLLRVLLDDLRRDRGATDCTTLMEWCHLVALLCDIDQAGSASAEWLLLRQIYCESRQASLPFGRMKKLAAGFDFTRRSKISAELSLAAAIGHVASLINEAEKIPTQPASME